MAHYLQYPNGDTYYGFDHTALNVPEAQTGNCYATYETLDDRLGLTNAYVPPPPLDEDELVAKYQLRQRISNADASDAFRRGDHSELYSRKYSSFDVASLDNFSRHEQVNRHTTSAHPKDGAPSNVVYDDTLNADVRAHLCASGLTPTMHLLNAAHYSIEPPYTGPLSRWDPRFVEPGALASERSAQAEMDMMTSSSSPSERKATTVNLKVTPRKRGPAPKKQVMFSEESPTKPRARQTKKTAVTAGKNTN